MPDTTPGHGPGGGDFKVAEFEREVARLCDRLICSSFVHDARYAQFMLDDDGLSFGRKAADGYPALRIVIRTTVVAYPIDVQSPPATGEGTDGI